MIILNLFELEASPSWAEEPFLFPGDVYLRILYRRILISDFDMNKGMLLDGQDNVRFILIFIVTELLGSFLFRDES